MRWKIDSIPKYISLFDDFYQKAKFHNFFVKNKNIRKIAEEIFTNQVTDKIDFGWFKKNFGFLPPKKFCIVIFFVFLLAIKKYSLSLQPNSIENRI
ncbi:MAG: DUF4932 domain-containing protein [Prevotellaceae bacterium]|nr:DUF4932 domain-containing protein [Prevotellaceae bacterium]